jgi:N-acetyl sugar amidotransferase
MNLVRSYQICTRCIMDTSDPEITFNTLGQCNHCETALRMLDHFSRIRADKSKTITEIVNEIKLHPGKEGFHAIIGVSGGVDSSYLLHMLSKQNIKLLAVHVDAGWNSIEAVRNINTMVSTLNIDLETIVIDWEEMQSLQVAYLKSGVINQDVPQDHAFFSSLYKLARKFDIKYVVSGSNYATESILPQAWGQNAMDGRQLIQINKKYGLRKLRKYPVTFLRDLYFHTYVLRSYRVVAPLNFVDYSKDTAMELLKKEYNWKDYGGKHKESRFTDYFQEIYLPDRFSIQKKRAHLSSLVVNGELSRESAIEVITSSKLDGLDRANLQQFVATKLGMNVDELDKLVNFPYVDDRKFANEAYLNVLITKLVRIRNVIRTLSRPKIPTTHHE